MQYSTYPLPFIKNPGKFFEKLLLTSALLPLKHKKSPPLSYTNTTKGGDFGQHKKFF
jgi:hypothetical protein